MTSFLKRLLNPGGRGSTESGPARLTLAAFGKHPGWNDHIPGIGVETEALAHVKQALYVSGIGGRIDAGAWRNLEFEKRIEGFGHAFLWLREGHVILGRMQSSEDGLHRKEYPLVLCVDAENVPSEDLLTRGLPELDRLLGACQATRSAEQVTAECRLAQERLRDVFVRDSNVARSSAALPPESRRRFIEHRDLGPDRVGLLRILHELGSTGHSGGGMVVDSRPRHVRLPLAADSRDHALLLWTAFLEGAIPGSLPLLLISRNGTEWIDAIVGEPTSDDFFCLQASLDAQPLASQIPYEVAPELKAQLAQLEQKFLGGQANLLSKPITTPPPRSVVPPATSQGQPPPSGKKSSWLVILSALILVMAAMIAVWLVGGNRGSPTASKHLADTNSSSAQAGSSVGANSIVQLTTNANTAGTAQPQADQEAKVRAEAEARRLAEAKRAAEEQAKAVPKSGPSRAEDPKAMDEDAGLAQIALAQGNYSRALEIAAKWPGNDRFKEVLSQVALETNQLFQLSQLLQAGDYPAILNRTNPLPDNAKFKEVLTQAETESKLLERGWAAFANGDYAFLRQPEMQSLQAKPPFQKLLQLGAAEADLLSKAQSFKAAHQPEAAHDLIVQSKLNKLPFAEIERWASVQLEKNAGQARDQQQAEALFRQGDYDRALELCKKYEGIAVFDSVAKNVRTERETLAAIERRFSGGDYSFLSNLSTQSYRAKAPFADLQRRGTTEQAALAELEKLKTANDWRGAQTALNKLTSDVQQKQPFAEVSQWAQTKAAEDEQQKSSSPAWLDSELEVLLVRFNVLKASDRWLQTDAARKEPVLEGALSLDTKEYYLNRVKWLRNEYTQRGWIAQRDRKKNLDRLESNIESR